MDDMDSDCSLLNVLHLDISSNFDNKLQNQKLDSLSPWPKDIQAARNIFFQIRGNGLVIAINVLALWNL